MVCTVLFCVTDKNRLISAQVIHLILIKFIVDIHSYPVDS